MEQLSHFLLILPQIPFKNNQYLLKDILSLSDNEKKIWVNFNQSLFYQGYAWLQSDDDKVYLHDNLPLLLISSEGPSDQLSQDCVFYCHENTWRIHQTARNWIYISDKMTPGDFKPRSFLKRTGFCSNEKSQGEIIDELFHQHTAHISEEFVKQKIQLDAFDDFPDKSQEISLTRATERWERSWKKIRESRQSMSVPSEGELTLDQVSQFLDLAFSASPRFDHRHRRGYPSSGSFYAECVMMEINQVKGLNKGTYLYHPIRHSLFFITQDTQMNYRLSFIFACRIDLLRKKYERISLRLMLLNTGVLMHQMSLGCALMGFNGHPSGTHKQFPWKNRIHAYWPAEWLISGKFIIY